PLGFVLVSAAAASSAAGPDPAPFDAVLKERARNGGVGYARGTSQDRKRPAPPLAHPRGPPPPARPSHQRQAFSTTHYNPPASGRPSTSTRTTRSRSRPCSRIPGSRSRTSRAPSAGRSTVSEERR